MAGDAFFNTRKEQFVVLTAQHALPTIFTFREFPAAGGLMSYGTSLAEGYRQTGVYAGRILKGEKPAEMPVQQAVKIETGHQPANCKDTRPQHSAAYARPRRRGDRMRPAYAACRVGSVIELWRDTRAGASSGK